MAAVAAPPMMRLTPRPYQYERRGPARGHGARVQRPLLVLPTGTGKTIVFASWCSGVQVAPHSGARDELIHQAVEKLHLVIPPSRWGSCRRP